MEENRFANETLKTVDIEKEIKQSFLDYSMSVIVSRALPDARDGLKPVHRRILYSMNENGLTHDKPTRKSANIVGAVLADYHPHGDASVYDAMVRLAQTFSMRYPLGRRRPPCGLSLYRSAHEKNGKSAARGYRQGNRRFRPQL